MIRLNRRLSLKEAALVGISSFILLTHLKIYAFHPDRYQEPSAVEIIESEAFSRWQNEVLDIYRFEGGDREKLEPPQAIPAQSMPKSHSPLLEFTGSLLVVGCFAVWNILCPRTEIDEKNGDHQDETDFAWKPTWVRLRQPGPVRARQWILAVMCILAAATFGIP